MAKGKANKDDTAFARVGRFASLGLTESWQYPLLVPAGYEDLRDIAGSIREAADKERCLIWLSPASAPSARFSSGVPLTTLVMADQQGGNASATIFGDTKVWLEFFSEFEGGYFLVQPGEYRGETTLRLLEHVDEQWAGKLRPKYPGKPKYLAAEKVREKVIEMLPSTLPVAAGHIETELAPLVERQRLLEAAGLPGWTVEQVLQETHQPASPKMAELSREALHRIAAFAALAKAHSHTINLPRARPLKLATWPVRMRALPFTSTTEQREVVLDIAADMAKPVATRRAVVADVGLGKSAPLMTAAVATHDAGGRTAILLPNLPLAEQLHNELSTTWPDVGAVLVTGDTKDQDLHERTILVGTTALLHRNVGQFDLVIVDEEQKFSVEQREQLAGTQAHMVTSTATCIPRSLALVRYGAVELSMMRVPHVKKYIQTRVWPHHQKRNLMTELRTFLAGSDQLLIVYPMREAGEDVDPLLSVEVASKGWESMYPGLVRMLTGDDDDETKIEVMRDMREGRAKILIATTVVEVGLTLPGLRRVMVVAPERYGLNTLHQLRGRAARKGGQGWFDLYSPQPLKDKQQEKLDRFTQCKDGFEVAELDLKLRGFGDLAQGSTKQSGSDDSFLFGSAITPDHVEPMEDLWQEVCRGHNHAQIRVG